MCNCVYIAIIHTYNIYIYIYIYIYIKIIHIVSICNFALILLLCRVERLRSVNIVVTLYMYLETRKISVAFSSGSPLHSF